MRIIFVSIKTNKSIIILYIKSVFEYIMLLIYIPIIAFTILIDSFICIIAIKLEYHATMI